MAVEWRGRLRNVSHYNKDQGEGTLGLPAGDVRWHSAPFMRQVTAVCDRCPLCSPPVALDSWQTLALSSVAVDPSIRSFDVAHVSTAAVSDLSAARDLCLLGKGSLRAHPAIVGSTGTGPHTSAAQDSDVGNTEETPRYHGVLAGRDRPGGDPGCAPLHSVPVPLQSATVTAPTGTHHTENGRHRTRSEEGRRNAPGGWLV